MRELVLVAAMTGDGSPRHAAILEHAAKAGGDVNALWDDHSALIWAVDRHHPALVETLLKLGARVDIKCPKGHTALSSAKDQPQVAAMLRRAGARE